MKTQWHNSWAV